MAKSKKLTFWFRAHLSCKWLRYAFFATPLWSCHSCNQFCILVSNQGRKSAPNLNDLYRGLKYFDDVKLTHGGDEEQVCLKYMKLSKIHEKPQILVYGSSDRFVVDLCLYIEVAKHLILVTYFCFILPQKDPFWFLLMLRISSAQVCKT